MRSKITFVSLVLFFALILVGNASSANFDCSVKHADGPPERWWFSPEQEPYAVNKNDGFNVWNNTSVPVWVYFKLWNNGVAESTLITAGATVLVPLSGNGTESHICMGLAKGVPLCSRLIRFKDVIPKNPTLTQWGIIILIGLMLASGVFIMLRRRKAVPA
jgi:hypothetical protein